MLTFFKSFIRSRSLFPLLPLFIFPFSADALANFRFPVLELSVSASIYMVTRTSCPRTEAADVALFSQLPKFIRTGGE